MPLQMCCMTPHMRPLELDEPTPVVVPAALDVAPSPDDVAEGPEADVVPAAFDALVALVVPVGPLEPPPPAPPPPVPIVEPCAQAPAVVMTKRAARHRFIRMTD